MKIVHLCAAMALACVAAYVPAVAFAAVAPNNEVNIIPAQYFDEATIIAVAGAIAATVNSIVVKLLGPWGWAAKLAQTEQIFLKYIKGGLLKLVAEHPELATKGVSIDVGNAFIASLARELVAKIPSWMLRWIGGAARVEDLIRNRLPEALRDIELPFDALSRRQASAG